MPKRFDSKEEQIGAPHPTRKFQHIIEVLKKNKGSLLLCRRVNSSSSHKIKDYLPCQMCLGFLYKYDLSRHAITCPGKDKDWTEENIHIKSAMLLRRSLYPEMEANLIELFATMKKDNIFKIIENDELIRRYGDLC